MKGVIPFRGVSLPRNRELLAIWRKENGIHQWSFQQQLYLALAFFSEPIAEDKLAGILFLQNHLHDKLPWEMLLARFEEIYTDELIFDWNVCDWFCVRVLGAMIKKHGEGCAKQIASWKDAKYLWKARSALVPFVNVASETKYYPHMQQVCTSLVKRTERFAKTAVGWVLRDVSKYDREFVEAFIANRISHFTTESMRNALKYFDAGQKNRYLQLLKNA